MNPVAVIPIACIIAVATSLGIAQDPAPTEFDIESTVRLRSVRLRLLTPPAAPDHHCDELTLDDLEVRVEGLPLTRADYVELDRTRRPTVHALLVDTSVSIARVIEPIRSAASHYARQIDWSLDSAFLAHFGDGVILSTAESRDPDEVVRGLRALRPGGQTALYDALVLTMMEFDDRLERPVIVLLTDGEDSGSLHERRDVMRYAAERPDLAVFVIGVGLPPINARSGDSASTRKFLERLARRTRGRYFNLPTVHTVRPTYNQVRSLLDREAELTVRDPFPDDSPRPLRVRSKRLGCKIETLFEVDEQRRDAGTETVDLSDQALPKLVDLRERIPDYSVHDGCDGAVHVRTDSATRVISGCALGVTMQTGSLFSATTVKHHEFNSWLKLGLRPFRFGVPPLAELPRSAGEALEFTLDDIPESLPKTDPRKRPASSHGRPYHDIPSWTDGWSWFGERRLLAGEFAKLPDVREWLKKTLDREAIQQRQILKR
ncbi:MAG: VWA domain-containing protein, partial [Acidobacteriota bacterium]|nr:VWA domain-containing protein [Acidobacteriota bacterium]